MIVGFAGIKSVILQQFLGGVLLGWEGGVEARAAGLGLRQISEPGGTWCYCERLLVGFTAMQLLKN